jgi:hypothetical protein
MTRELVQKTVDGRSYEFEQFNTTTALKTLAKLTKIIGEPLMIALGALGLEKLAPAKLVNGVPEPVKKRNLMDTDLNPLNTAVLGKAVAALIDRLDETEVVDLVKRLVSGPGVLCDHKPFQFDDHFIGEPGHLFKVVRAALEAQYGNFLGAVTGGDTSSTARPVSVRQ